MLMTGIAETALGALDVMSDVGVFGAIQGVLSLTLLIPSLAVSVRRLHDINLNGAWLIPFAGLTVLGSALSVMGGDGGVARTVPRAGCGAAGFDFILLGSVITVVTGIAYAVCMAWPSNPEGARFDKPR